MNTATVTTVDALQSHKLADEWTLWAHLPHDSNWTQSSYKKIMTVATVESAVSLIEQLPPNLVDNCMLFVMRKGINPMWEDKQNCNGGCFSYCVSNDKVHHVWKTLFYAMIGGTISTKTAFVENVNGITISPKKKFCVIKVWMASCDYQDPALISTATELSSEGCLFKKHKPEW